MQFDRTQIVIRERGLGEILDLALRVIASNARSLSLVWLAGTLPFALVNALLLLPVIRQLETTHQVVVCVTSSVLLVFTEMPWALLGVTAYSGQAMFDDEPRLWRVWTACRQSFRPASWWLGWVRGLVPVWVLVFLATREGPFRPIGWVLLTLWLVPLLWIRACRPFLPEVIVLEQPLGPSDRPAEPTVTRRMRSLHAGYAGDGFARMLALSGLAILIVWCLYRTLCFLWETLVSDVPTSWGLAVVLPLTLWLAAGFFTVVRFLSYIDLRVRREGWEVELLLRAAQADVPGVESSREHAVPER